MTPTQKSIRIAADESGGRLDRLLAVHVAELSRTRLKALIEAGAVSVDGRTIRDPGYRVNSGAAVVVAIPPAAPAKPAAEPIPLKVIYEDADIIVIDKPKGLVVHPAAGNWTGTLVNALISHCGESLSGIGGERRPGIVHRLDKDTTGLMVVAKNDRAHRALAAQFAGHGRGGGPFERGYLAFVWGAPDRPRGTIDRPIGRHPQARNRMAIREGGREAITHWQVLERYGGTKGARRGGTSERPGEPVASLLACRLETARRLSKADCKGAFDRACIRAVSAPDLDRFKAEIATAFVHAWWLHGDRTARGFKTYFDELTRLLYNEWKKD